MYSRPPGHLFHLTSRYLHLRHRTVSDSNMVFTVSLILEASNLFLTILEHSLATYLFTPPCVGFHNVMRAFELCSDG